MARRIIRWLLLLVLAASAAGTVLTAARIASDPLIAPFTAASKDEIIAATDRMLASAATPETLQAHVANRLAEDPRNWLALDALLDLATERGIDLPPDLLNAVTIAREDDHSYYANVADCAVCAYDASTCALDKLLICQVPISLTPIGDLTGIVRAGVAYSMGDDVDQIDLALSVVGLGATVAILASGGTSGIVKAGAGLAKLARKMGRLSPRLTAMALEAARTGVDWAKLPAVRSLDELTAVVHMKSFEALTETVVDLGRTAEATDITTALHLLPMVDDASDARRLAHASEALGKKIVGRAEVLGKSRLFRATVRFSKTALAVLVELNLMFLSLAGLGIHMIQTVILRRLHKRLHGPVDRPADLA